MSATDPVPSSATDRLTIADVRAAAERIAGAVVETPMLHSLTLSRIAGCEIWLKFENLQFTAAYKERGALNRLSALTADERARGVIAASAGNHAQGVAHHARRLGVAAKSREVRGIDRVVIRDGDSIGRMLERIGAPETLKVWEERRERREVPAGAVAADRDAFDVAIDLRRVARDPAGHGDAVVDRGRKAVLGAQAIVGRDDDPRAFAGHQMV